MPEGLVVAQTIAQGPLEGAHRGKEAIMCRASAQNLPEPLNHLELGAVARQPVQLQMREAFEPCGDQGPFVPGGVVDHQDHSRIPGGGIGAGQIPQLPDDRRLQGALARRGTRPLPDPRAQMASHQIQCAKDIDHVVAVQVADHGPYPLRPRVVCSVGIIEKRASS
jgi:hypothetical protein